MADNTSNKAQTGSQASGDPGRRGEDDRQTSYRRGAAANHSNVAARVAASSGTAAEIVAQRQREMAARLQGLDDYLPVYLRRPPANVDQNSKMHQELDGLLKGRKK